MAAESSAASSMLRAAAALVDGPRQQTHGDKRAFCENTARLWNAYIRSAHGADAALTGADVAQLMALFKMARTFGGAHHADNYVDGAAYVAIAGEVALREKTA